MAIVDWVKKNKLSTVLLAVFGYFLFNSVVGTFFGARLLSGRSYPSESSYGSVGSYNSAISLGAPASKSIPNIALPIPGPDYTPEADVENRLVIQESNVSLLVKDVVETRNNILEYASSSGGYMVNTSTRSPQDAPTATLVIRIPSAKLQEALDYFHSLSIKVVSENLTGRDVTDQYVDIEARLATYEKTKSKFESILDQATKISDITSLTREIISIQGRIDSLKGQQDSLEKNAQLAKLTIYLSTDEMALPYAPSETFRPNIIFKLAVRSLVGFARKLVSVVIWLGVYSVIWVPALAVYIFGRKWLAKRRAKAKQTPSPLKPQQ